MQNSFFSTFSFSLMFVISKEHSILKRLSRKYFVGKCLFDCDIIFVNLLLKLVIHQKMVSIVRLSITSLLTISLKFGTKGVLGLRMTSSKSVLNLSVRLELSWCRCPDLPLSSRPINSPLDCLP